MDKEMVAAQEAEAHQLAAQAEEGAAPAPAAEGE
jgi:hypothetical protein